MSTLGVTSIRQRPPQVVDKYIPATRSTMTDEERIAMKNSLEMETIINTFRINFINHCKLYKCDTVDVSVDLWIHKPGPMNTPKKVGEKLGIFSYVVPTKNEEIVKGFYECFESAFKTVRTSIFEEYGQDTLIEIRTKISPILTSIEEVTTSI